MKDETKYPAMLVYVQDFVADPKVATMEPDEIGCYWLLLCYLWIDGYLTTDDNELKKLCRAGRKWKRIRAKVLPRFIEVNDPDLGPVLTHKRQEMNLAKLRETKQVRKKAANVRWAKNDAHASDLHMQNDASSSSSSSSSSDTSTNQSLSKKRPEKRAFDLQARMEQTLANYGATKRHGHGGLYHMMCQYLPEQVIDKALSRVSDLKQDKLAGKKQDVEPHRYFIGTIKSICKEERVESPIKWK